jgi:Zn-dependent protease
MHQTAQTACPHCGRTLGYGEFTCRTCGAAANQRLVDDIASDAIRLEGINPAAAALTWRRALDLLPPESRQFQQIERRAAALSGTGATASLGGESRRWPLGPPPLPLPPQEQERAVRPPDPLPLALLKTLGSMIVASVIYYLYPFHSVTIAVGFVVLMLIHEMGHVFATWYYGLSASPPIFIPYLGALINLRESPPNALVESIIGIGGPMLGTAGAIACYFLALASQGQLQFELLVVTQLAVMLNLFNLLPVPPLDGGRITAAVSPWIWLAGLAGLGVMIFLEISGGAFFSIFILVLLLGYALPRIRSTFQARGMHVPYYNISRWASWTMGVLYVTLGLFLIYMFQHLGGFGLLQAGIEG